MPTQYDPASEEDRDTRGADREISLGTGTVLAIFLALALVCSLFFGLGYSMGKKSAPLVPVAAAVRTAMPTDDLVKPSSGSPARLGASKADNQVSQPSTPTEERFDPPSTDTSNRPHKAGSKVTIQDRSIAGDSLAPEIPANTPAATGAQSFVQVAAVSRKEDADLLLSALKHRGYTGLVRQQPQDKLLHIQVGPFPSKKEAELMRQRLIVDGYNPIIK